MEQTDSNSIKKKIVNVFVCLQCREIKTQRHEPPSYDCRAGRYHVWRNFGEKGNDRYRCKGCGIIVSVQMQPSALGCTSTAHHYWEKLLNHD